MKAIKETDQGLLLNFFGTNGRYYLSAAHLSFFDLNDPERILPEQELWPMVQAELGPTVFDLGLPKPMGEVLVWGRCFAPGGRPARAVRAGLRIGPVSKEVLAFGFRHWSTGTIGGHRITEPLQFTSIDLRYENAFGGQGFPLNPIGMGLERIALPTGETGLPLPYLEKPDRLIAAIEDRPEPAGFAPMDLAWPQRSGKMGTFDQVWQQEHWPFFPQDVDWSFVNAAPNDQWLPKSYNDGFFKGDEPIVMLNMHPGFQEYHSRLPFLRPRCFVQQLEDIGQPKGNKIFKEVSLHLETVWLFPHLERGVLIHRGVAEAADDEGLDVEYVFLVKEDVNDKAEDLDHYRRELDERLKFGTPREVEPLKEADALLAQAKARLDELPDIIEEALDQIQQKAPTPNFTLEETARRALEDIARHRASLAEHAGQLKLTQAAFGHRVKIANPADGFHRGLDNMEKEIAQTMATLADSRKTMADQLGQGRAAAEKFISGLPPGVKDRTSGILDEMTIPEHIPPAEERWQTQAMRFLQYCRESLRDHPEVMDLFHWVGLSDRTIRRSWIGYNPSDLEVSRFEWGLTDSRDDHSTMILPQGWTQPYFDDAELRHLRMRPPVTGFEWLSREVEGSRERLMFLSPRPGRPVLVLNFSIEAWLTKQFIGRICNVVVLARPDMELKPEQKEILARAPQLLIAEYPSDKPIMTRYPLEEWKKINANAEIVPIPRRATSLLEARKMGLDLEQWIRGLIKPELLAAIKPESVHDQIESYHIDASEIIAKKRKELETLVQARMGEFEKLKDENLAALKETCLQAGIPPVSDEFFKMPEQDSAPPLFTVADANPVRSAQEKVAGRLDDMKARIKDMGGTSPDVERELAGLEKNLQENFDRAAEQYDQGMARLKELEARPQWAKDLLKDAGFDPEGPPPMKPMTREEVAQYKSEGKSLAGKNLAGLDLSGMDLSGLDLKGAHLIKTSFKGSNLTGSDLTGVLAEDVDFGKAFLDEALLTGAVLTRARFVEAQLSRADFSKTMLKEVNLSKADLHLARLEGACLEKADCQEAVFTNVSAAQATFIGTDLKRGIFRGAGLSRATFLGSTVDEADLSESDLTSANFISTTGKRVNFSKANLTNARFLQDSSFQDSDFNEASADRLFGQQTDLSGCHFKRAELNRALIEDCNLSGANLTGAVAKEARFNKSDLTLSRLTGINLMFGSLRKAKLGFADLSSGSFFGAEFHRIKIAETSAQDADFKRTKLEKFAQQVFGQGKKKEDRPDRDRDDKERRHEPK